MTQPRFHYTVDMQAVGVSRAGQHRLAHRHRLEETASLMRGNGRVLPLAADVVVEDGAVRDHRTATCFPNVPNSHAGTSIARCHGTEFWRTDPQAARPPPDRSTSEIFRTGWLVTPGMPVINSTFPPGRHSSAVTTHAPDDLPQLHVALREMGLGTYASFPHRSHLMRMSHDGTLRTVRLSPPRRSANRVIEADLGAPLTRLRPEGGIRLDCLALQRLADWTATGCNWHALDFPGGITGEAKAIDQLVALIEVRLADQRRGEALA